MDFALNCVIRVVRTSYGRAYRSPFLAGLTYNAFYDYGPPYLLAFKGNEDMDQLKQDLPGPMVQSHRYYDSLRLPKALLRMVRCSLSAPDTLFSQGDFRISQVPELPL